MREIIDEVSRWLEAGEERISVATVLKTYGSAPRGVGGKMAIGQRGQVAGSISGGCIEASIIDEAMKVTPGDPPKVLHFETSDDSAWEVGLPCGGTIDVLLEPIAPAHLEFLGSRMASNEAAFQVTVIAGDEKLLGRKIAFDGAGSSVGSVGSPYDSRLIELAGATTQTQCIRAEGEMELFIELFPPAPTLFIVGGVHIAVALVRIARLLGYLTVVIDPRKTFGNPERFPDVDRLVQEWPRDAFERFRIGPDSAVVVLTHDPKLDDPALVSALGSPAFYIGALGSARTQERRRDRLQRRGFSAAQLSRIHGPVGLDIGASSPEEIALSISSEIVALRRGARSVLRVSDFALQGG